MPAEGSDKNSMSTNEEAKFKSGFINIIGKPNAGKSTLMNALIGERMSIISPKPQTTRHRIMGILTNERFQMVFSDTPGYVDEPSYRMHEAMNKYVLSTLEDADAFLWLINPFEKSPDYAALLETLSNIEVPLFILINKTDQINEEVLNEMKAEWSELLPGAIVLPISALTKNGCEALLLKLEELLPEGPMYFPEDQISDRLDRFFISEIIREKIFHQYQDEIPYTSEVVIEEYKETTTNLGVPIARIRAYILVERETQKGILLGKAGAAMKKTATAARISAEEFLGTKVYLEITIKVVPKWRDDERMLKRLGYE